MSIDPDPTLLNDNLVHIRALDSGRQVVGFNAQSGQYEDFIESGIIDSTKMVCTALQMAASVAGLLIKTEAAIALSSGERLASDRRYGYDEF